MIPISRKPILMATNGYRASRATGCSGTIGEGTSPSTGVASRPKFAGKRYGRCPSDTITEFISRADRGALVD